MRNFEKSARQSKLEWKGYGHQGKNKGHKSVVRKWRRQVRKAKGY